MNKGLLTLLTIVLALVGFSCDQGMTSSVVEPVVDGDSGTLVLVLQGQSSRTLMPDVDMNITSYRITGSGPGGASFTLSSTDTTVIQEDLTFGDWTISVEGLNAADGVIARGTGAATVVVDSTSSVNITVTPLSGFGTLDLTINWPSMDVFLPAIQASLMPLSGQERQLSTDTLDVAAGRATINVNDVEAGFYTLSLRLTDRGQLVMGSVDIVWIAAGVSTTGTFHYDNVNDAQGSINISITPEMTQPLDLTIDGLQNSLPEDQQMALSPQINGYSGNCLYFWYINGRCVSTDEQYRFTAVDHGQGYYRVDLTVISADFTRGGSAGATFTVVEDTTAPQVLSVTPVDGATSIASDTDITVVFSDCMDTATLNNSTVTLMQGATPVATTLILADDLKTLRVSPTSDLGIYTEYQLNLDTAITDVLGNPLGSAVTSTFRTWNDTNELLGISFPEILGTVDVEILDDAVLICFPDGTDHSDILLNFSHSGREIKIDGVSIASNTGRFALSAERTLEIIAENGVTKQYRILANPFIATLDFTITDEVAYALNAYLYDSNKTEDYIYVDWGDGSIEKNSISRFQSIQQVFSSGPLHNYGEDIYIMKIYGFFSMNGTECLQPMAPSNQSSLTAIHSWGLCNLSNSGKQLSYRNLVEIPQEDPIALFGLTNIILMFDSARQFNQDISHWDISSITNIGGMFFNAQSFNQDISSWNTSNVTSMRRLFSYSYEFNQDLSTWDTSKVTNMDNLFSYASSFNQDISTWDTSNVTSMNSMFERASTFNQDISTWDTSNVTNMRRMFNAASTFNQNLSTWDTSKVTDMGYMFAAAESFNKPLYSWDVSNVTDMSGMFNAASTFNQNLSTWDTLKVTDMGYMFSAAVSFNKPLNSWDVSNVTDMRDMFMDAGSFNQPLNSWDVSNVTDMTWMFKNAVAFNRNISLWDTSNVRYMRGMFEGASQFNCGEIDINNWNWNVNNVSYMNSMFNATPLQGNEPSWYTP